MSRGPGRRGSSGRPAVPALAMLVLAGVAAADRVAAEPVHDEPEWRALAALPPAAPGEAPLGRAGLCVGATRAGLLAVGGSNFPEPGRTPTRGGIKQYHDDAYLYFAAGSIWSRLEGRLPVRADQFLAVPVEDGVLCIGGVGFARRDGSAAAPAPLATVFHVSVGADARAVQVTRWPDLPEPVAVPVGGRVGTQVLVAGRARLYALDLADAARRWTTLERLPWSPRDEFAGTVTGGALYVLGGRGVEDGSWRVHRDVWRYEAAARRWKRLADLPVALAHATAFGFDGAALYVVGGVEREPFATLERTRAAAGGSGRGARAAAARLTQLYDHDPGFHARVWRYEIAANRWTPAGWHPGTPAIKRQAARYGGGFALVGGEVNPGKRTSAAWHVAPAAAASGREPAVTVFRGGADGYPIYRIPAVVRAANGDLLAFAEARSGGDASEIDLVAKRSTDGGRSWSALQVVVGRERFREELPAGAEVTIGNPAPVVDTVGVARRGRIVLPFTLENARVFVTHSDDHGATWAEPIEITSDVRRPGWGWYAVGPGHAIQLTEGPHRGRLVVPANHRLGTPGADDGPPAAHVLLSDDGGRTWRLGAVDESYADGIAANETTVAELADGRLYFNTRNQNGSDPATRGVAWSADGGASYDCGGDCRGSPFAPAPPALDPPVVQASVLRADAGGTRVLFAGPDTDGPSGPGRSDLTIRLSVDTAATWCDLLRIHVGPAAYSDLVALGPAEFGVLYEAGASAPNERIDFVPFGVADAARCMDAVDQR